PRAFVDSILRLYFPDMAQDFTAEVMTWKIFRLLPGLAQRREFARVRQYLDTDDGLKTFQLAERIAALFDQYLVYRPDMLTRWETGADEDWQAILWRTLTEEKSPLHLAAISGKLSPAMAAPPPGGGLPERVSLFGISSLPPLYLRVFTELSRHCEVNFFCLHPSQEYFGHDLPPKRRAGREDYFSGGNPLLASLGKLNRDFIDLRMEIDERAGHLNQDQTLDFIDPGEDTMLHAVQADILYARCRGDGETPKLARSAGDASIQIHACHSPTREIEVLYDQLLDMLARIPGLRPRDIVVMTPDIEKYAPFIEAIFGYPEDPARPIPFSVADRRPLSVNPVVEAFAALLAIPGSRCTASEFFSILDRAPVRRRFAFKDEDLALIRQWIAESGIRWGIDAAHRAGFDLPALDANTWQAGIRRLLLGFAMPGGRMFEEIMPYSEVEGGAAETLGPLISAVEALFKLAGGFSAPRTVAAWAVALTEIVDQFFTPEDPEDASGLRLVREAIYQFRSAAQNAAVDEAIHFRTVRYHVLQLLNRSEQRGGFLTGGVTFCALQPMRSIPARVLCLIGMDDQAYPRQNRAAAFDLMAREPRSGDRSMRDDDRYIFLESIISARERLYCSFIGRSIIDNEARPPSPLIGEMLDYLDHAFEFPDGAKDSLLIEHKLHAFSPAYYDGRDSRLFSYSRANAAAARNLRTHVAPPTFLDGPLPPPESTAVELDRLIEFFRHPAKFFVRRRLGLLLKEDDDTLDDDEPFEIASMESYHLKEELVARGLEGTTARAQEFTARGLLPLGEIGAAHFRDLSRDADDFRKSVERELAGAKRGEPVLIDLRAGRFSLTGKIDGIYGDKVIQFRCAKLKAKDILRAWITHLARGGGETVLIAADETWRFPAMDGSAAHLERLLEIYWQGLARPIHFFPVSSHAYALALIKPSPRAKSLPLDKARTAWHGNEFNNRGERKEDEGYFDFCFGDSDPLDAEFERLALAVFEPVLTTP
ncbi:MAG TPA: exodeoxyribonuclease V subunit gamma, partial [Chthoniobacteraceae bacterium]|nr:exodeoxyribonuclease V subunit gamma [Chthoniobacteraceae bacterium]